MFVCKCSVWIVSGPASSSEITVIDPARSNTVLDQFSLPPTAPALCICTVPPIGQCQYIGHKAAKGIITFDTYSLVLFCQVTLQEPCGLGRRKEGSARWISRFSSVGKDVSASVSDLFFLPLSLLVFWYTRLLLAGGAVCSLFPSQKVFIHLRKSPAVSLVWDYHLIIWAAVYSYPYIINFMSTPPQVFSGSGHSWFSWWDVSLFLTQFR